MNLLMDTPCICPGPQVIMPGPEHLSEGGGWSMRQMRRG